MGGGESGPSASCGVSRSWYLFVVFTWICGQNEVCEESPSLFLPCQVPARVCWGPARRASFVSCSCCSYLSGHHHLFDFASSVTFCVSSLSVTCTVEECLIVTSATGHFWCWGCLGYFCWSSQGSQCQRCLDFGGLFEQLVSVKGGNLEVESSFRLFFYFKHLSSTLGNCSCGFGYLIIVFVCVSFMSASPFRVCGLLPISGYLPFLTSVSYVRFSLDWLARTWVWTYQTMGWVPPSFDCVLSDQDFCAQQWTMESLHIWPVQLSWQGHI